MRTLADLSVDKFCHRFGIFQLNELTPFIERVEPSNWIGYKQIYSRATDIIKGKSRSNSNSHPHGQVVTSQQGPNRSMENTVVVIDESYLDFQIHFNEKSKYNRVKLKSPITTK